MDGAIAARLAPTHTVVVLDRTGDVVVDLGDADDVRRAADQVLERHSGCDVLVHAAAMRGNRAVRRARARPLAPGSGRQRRIGAPAHTGVRAGNARPGFGRVIFIVSNTFWRPAGLHM